MKVIGVAGEVSWRPSYVCIVSLDEINKFLNVYYKDQEKLRQLKIGDEIDLGRGFDFAENIDRAMRQTQDFVKAHQPIITAIMQGLSIQALLAAAEQQASTTKTTTEVGA